MLITLIIVGIVFYAVCWLLTYKATFAYFQKEYPEQAKGDQTFARGLGLVLGIFGPASLAMVFFLSDRFKHGFTAHDR